MAKQNIGQLVYTLEIEDQKAVRALQTFESKAATSGNRVTSHFTRIEKETVKAQRALFGMASAADLLDAKLGGFVFSGVRAVEVLTAIGASASRTSTAIKDTTKSLSNFQQVERALAGEIAAKATEPIPRVRRGAGGRFESIPGSAAAAAARSGSTISTETLSALAIGPTIERSALAAQKASTAMTLFAKATTLASGAVAFLGVGLKALFSPVSVVIGLIAGAFYLYERASNAAVAADEKRKKAIEEATEAHKKYLAVLTDISARSTAASPLEPGRSAISLRASRAEGLGPIAQINSGAAATQNAIREQLNQFRAERDKANEDLKLVGGSEFLAARTRGQPRTAAQQESLNKSIQAERDAKATVLRTTQAIANLEEQSGVEELNRARKVSEESQKAKDAFERGIASLQEGITSLPGRLSEGIKREQARIKNERNERVTAGLGTEADIIAFARERGNEQKAQDELKKSVKALVDRGEFGSLGKVISKVFGLDEDAKPIDAPAGTSRRFSSSGILGSSVGGFTRADVLGSGRTPEDEQVSLLTQIASVLTKIERKQIVGLQP